MACTNQSVREKPIDEFVLGTWLADSTNRKLGKDEHPRIQFLEFLPGKKAVSHFFSIRHNKVYENEVEYSLTDTSFNYTDEFSLTGPFSARYRVEPLDDTHFRLVAKFPTSNWSDPDRDSVIWYSRVTSAEAYLRPIMESGMASKIKCPAPNMALIHGYWKMDSTEYINRTSSEKHYYFFIDTSGTMYTLWLGRKPHRQSNPIKIGRYALIGDDGDSIPITCLDNEHMVFEMPERKGSYEAVFFSRIDPDTIIPDSLRFDWVKLPTKARP